MESKFKGMSIHMNNAFIEVIPHKLQRYDTAGDYFQLSNGMVHFRISEMENPDYEFLVSVHEQVEQYLCHKAGIDEEDITQWDLDHIEDPDPGSIPGCPYQAQHLFAMKVEQMLARKLNLDWEAYDKSFEKLQFKGASK